MLVDIVNFNADASCLEVGNWLAGLCGGEESRFYRWLQLYVELERPVVLGLTGATVADLMVRNPESIKLINSYPDIFQIIIRPFSHDAALLRTPQGFFVNFLLGRMILERAFGEPAPYYLPPEFMLMPEQVRLLQSEGVDSTFINACHYALNQQERVPNRAYRLSGPLGSSLGCIPVHGMLTKAYFDSLDRASGVEWNTCLDSVREQIAYCWRDGESCFLFPQGLERERLWLEQEKVRSRSHLSVSSAASMEQSEYEVSPYFRSYPVHSLSAWMKEFRMIGYIQRVLKAESRVEEMGHVAAGLWMQCINSDVLSSVEKDAVVKKIVNLNDSQIVHDIIFHRSERGFEGSECLLLLEAALDGGDLSYLFQDESAHISKVRDRVQVLEQLLEGRVLGDLMSSNNFLEV